MKYNFNFNIDIISPVVINLEDYCTTGWIILINAIQTTIPETLNLFIQHVLGNTPTELCLIRNTPVSSKYGNMYSNSLLMRSNVKFEFFLFLKVLVIWCMFFGVVGFFVSSMIKNLLNSVNGNANVVIRVDVWRSLWPAMDEVLFSFTLLAVWNSNKWWFFH